MNRGLSIGGITILEIFIILSLAIFSVTAVSSANADLNFSKRTIASAEAYYKADGNAQKIISEIDGILSENANDFSTVEQKHGIVFEEYGDILAFRLPVSEYNELWVELDIAPESVGNRYDIIAYQIMPVEDGMNYEQKLNVWTGESEEE